MPLDRYKASNLEEVLKVLSSARANLGRYPDILDNPKRLLTIRDRDTEKEIIEWIADNITNVINYIRTLGELLYPIFPFDPDGY